MKKSVNNHLEVFQESTIKNLKKRKLPKRFSISTSEGILYMPIKDIIRLEARESYTEFTIAHTNKKILASINLGEFKVQFDPYRGFMRVHRSHLVNLEYVDKYIRADGGYLVMQDGATVSVSRFNRNELLSRLEEI